MSPKSTMPVTLWSRASRSSLPPTSRFASFRSRRIADRGNDARRPRARRRDMGEHRALRIEHRAILGGIGDLEHEPVVAALDHEILIALAGQRPRAAREPEVVASEAFGVLE